MLIPNPARVRSVSAVSAARQLERLSADGLFSLDISLDDHPVGPGRNLDRI